MCGFVFVFVFPFTSKLLNTDLNSTGKMNGLTCQAQQTICYDIVNLNPDFIFKHFDLNTCLRWNVCIFLPRDHFAFDNLMNFLSWHFNRSFVCLFTQHDFPVNANCSPSRLWMGLISHGLKTTSPKFLSNDLCGVWNCDPLDLSTKEWWRCLKTAWELQSNET